MAKAPRPGAGKRAAVERSVYKITIDGTAHYLRLGEVSAIETGELRRATGFGLRHLGYALLADPDIDVVAGVVWLARRQAGERSLPYDTVAGAITYDTAIDIDVVDSADAEKEETESPEA
jgi:hypothetical protein